MLGRAAAFNLQPVSGRLLRTLHSEKKYLCGWHGAVRRSISQRHAPPISSQHQLVIRYRWNSITGNNYKNNNNNNNLRRIQHFSTKTEGPLRVAVTKANQKAERQTWATRFRRLAFLVKYVRIPFLMVSVYMFGKQQGIIECSRNPRLVEDELLQSVLADVGVKDRSQVKIFTSEENTVLAVTKTGNLQAKTIKIGNDIIRVASIYVREQIVKAVNKVREKVPSDISNEEFIKACHKDDDFQFWTTALYRVEGEDPNVPWRYVLVDTPLANAFVSEILPQRFFITTSMFHHYITNEDELALVLGHEMSHLILGHVSQRNSIETVLRTIEVLLLSLDPTEGLATLGVVGGLAWIRGIVMASFSRDNETEADELGIQLAAMACYDTKKGALVMKRMHDHQSELGQRTSNSQLLTMMDSHPPSLARYQKLEQLSETENPLKYHDACASVYRKMTHAIWGKSKRSSNDGLFFYGISKCKRSSMQVHKKLGQLSRYFQNGSWFFHPDSEEAPRSYLFAFPTCLPENPTTRIAV